MIEGLRRKTGFSLPYIEQNLYFVQCRAGLGALLPRRPSATYRGSGMAGGWCQPLSVPLLLSTERRFREAEERGIQAWSLASPTLQTPPRPTLEVNRPWKNGGLKEDRPIGFRGADGPGETGLPRLRA